MPKSIQPKQLTLIAEAKQFLMSLNRKNYDTARELGDLGINQLRDELLAKGTRVSAINNRRYLGNKHAITGFIRNIIDEYCHGVNSVADVFTGTGAVANAFIDKTLVTNDLLYSNYLTSLAWFSPEDYRPQLIIKFTNFLNSINTDVENYVRKNFADTYFPADDCSKIGEARQLVQEAYNLKLINTREHSILVTSIIYGMDRIANTVGHYDAYRKNAGFDKTLEFPVLFPEWNLSTDNQILNKDANDIIGSIHCDLLYLDPPYNSRQYSDAYHLLENIAKWEQPEVFGIARKMNRAAIKSDYNTVRATEALRDLVSKSRARYIAFSYNNMATKGNGRSNAKISDSDIIEILKEKGSVQVFETAHKPFSTGKSEISDNRERLFVCTVENRHTVNKSIVQSPINYIGGKGKLISQLQPLLPHSELFVDVFSGGCTVGSNIDAEKVIFNDINSELINLLSYLVNNEPLSIISELDRRIQRLGLSDTFRNGYAFYGTQSSEGLASYNKEAYLKLRDQYNLLATDSEEKSPLLYLLIIFGFNNQIRFNSKGLFNLPVGKRDFNSKMRKKLELFHNRVNQINYSFTSVDFRKIDIAETPDDTLFYCDPPYLITQATYNENGAWSESLEQDLLSFLDSIAHSGRKFALSNVISAKGRSNEILQSWLESRSYKVTRLSMNYQNSNYQRSNKTSPTIEVLVTNY